MLISSLLRFRVPRARSEYAANRFSVVPAVEESFRTITSNIGCEDLKGAWLSFDGRSDIASVSIFCPVARGGAAVMGFPNQFRS